MIARIRNMNSARSLFSIGILLAFLLVMTPRASSAQGQAQIKLPDSYTPGSIISVNTFDDEINSDGDCSLREAVQAANTNSVVDACTSGSGEDTISLLQGTYTLSIGGGGEDNNQEGDLDISGVLTITGASAATTFVQAGTDTNNGIDRVLHGLPDSHLTVENVTIRFGQAMSGGSPHINGGGIYMDTNSELHVFDCTIFDNEGANGGGVVYNFSTVNIENSVISDNDGGSGGGGLIGWGTATLVNSTLANNTAASGGGITNNGTLIIYGSTLSGNSAFDPFSEEGYGGAIHNNDVMTITNSTISGNNAVTQGGGIRNFGQLKLQNSVVVNNTALTGGGIFGISGVVSTTNSIIAGNLSGGDCRGMITSQDYNLDSDSSCNLAQPHDKPNVNPMLGSLANNGGSTQTHELLVGSPAINGGDCSMGTVLVDQRGIARPQGSACDIGSYEYDGPPFVNAKYDQYATVEDIPLLVTAPGVLANDVSFNSLTATLVTGPQNGFVELSLDGSFIYTPTVNYFDYDIFSYIASDGTMTDTSYVSIYIAPVNDAPIPMADYYTATEGISLTVTAPGVLENDFDVDSEVLTATLATSPMSGTLSLNPDGSFVYHPAAGFAGVDSFTYFVSDGLSNSAPVTVTIYVTRQDYWLYVYVPVVLRSSP
jgi:CSLREA domain-containing protein